MTVLGKINQAQHPLPVGQPPDGQLSAHAPSFTSLRSPLIASDVPLLVGKL